MKPYICTYEQAGIALGRCKRWVCDAGRSGALDFARLPGKTKKYGITTASVERLMRQAAKQPPKKPTAKVGP